MTKAIDIRAQMEAKTAAFWAAEEKARQASIKAAIGTAHTIWWERIARECYGNAAHPNYTRFIDALALSDQPNSDYARRIQAAHRARTSLAA